MPIKYVLAASLFFLAAARAPAQESDASGCAEEDAKWCNLKAKLGQLPNLSRFLQGDEEKGRQFAAAAYNSPASQDEEWKAFDTLLGGGRLDPGGALISGELKKLAPEQWYYVIRLEAQRKILVGLGGGLFGNFTEGFGNIFRAQEHEMHVMKCHEQGEALMRNMQPVKSSGRPAGVFTGWSSQLVTANFQKLNEHNAPCFNFSGAGEPVEIVADSWGDMIVPARVWWQKYDPSVPSQMGGREACGETYRDWDGARTRALNKQDEERAARYQNNLKKMRDTFEHSKFTGL